ncbi:hypothetical protein EZY14_009225 [Kordia sp. TARA_039_SRF]|nr:hypothetical protein EZY14_009225 [Kordia sp. TARA_039_SRF]
MRVKGDNLSRLIAGKSFKTEITFCDICGSANNIVYHNILVEERSMDFCKCRSDHAIRNYIEMGLPAYSYPDNTYVPTEEELISKQIQIKM